MAQTTVETGNVVQQWSQDYFASFIRGERFRRYSGPEKGKIFHHVMDLTKKAGDSVTVSLVAKLSGDGVTGDNTLEGNEEALGNYSDTITVDQLRHAVSRGNHEQSKTLIDILEAGRDMLKKWSTEKLRDLKIARMLCPNLDGVTAYAATGEGDRDLHLVANADRYLFGALISNGVSAVHATALATLDTTADILSMAIVRLAKRVAKSASPLIGPVTLTEDEEWYVMFVGTNPFRDLKANMDTVHQNAAPRSLKENPIFRDGDLVLDSTIIREIPEMVSVGNVGSASAPVYQAALCGPQAVCVAWSEMTNAKTNGRDGRDYGNVRAAAIVETRGAKKTHFNSKQHGMVTCYVASAADA